MKKWILALVSTVFFMLSACTHLVLDSTERLQVKNLSDQDITDLSVVGKSDTIVWIPDTVAPGELSFVHEQDFVGSFHIIFKTLDSTGAWEIVDMGKIDFDGGSELLKISKKDGEWDHEFE
ncbi:MAG: hypothetical protein K6A31_01715 [Fibrobacter sp.]|nr:hypothetical protein [Fibrobacter sp.]